MRTVSEEFSAAIRSHFVGRDYWVICNNMELTSGKTATTIPSLTIVGVSHTIYVLLLESKLLLTKIDMGYDNWNSRTDVMAYIAAHVQDWWDGGINVRIEYCDPNLLDVCEGHVDNRLGRMRRWMMMFKWLPLIAMLVPNCGYIYSIIIGDRLTMVVVGAICYFMIIFANVFTRWACLRRPKLNKIHGPQHDDD